MNDDWDPDVLASILAIVIASNRTAEEIRDNTGVTADDIEPAIAYLQSRNRITAIGARHYHATQSLCAGSCSRGGRLMRGEEVVINPQTLRWMCAECWDGPDEPPRDSVPGDDGSTDTVLEQPNA